MRTCVVGVDFCEIVPPDNTDASGGKFETGYKILRLLSYVFQGRGCEIMPSNRTDSSGGKFKTGYELLRRISTLSKPEGAKLPRRFVRILGGRVRNRV